MRVLWITNMVLPFVAESLGLKTSTSGSWLIDYANMLSKDKSIELATMTYSNIETYTDITVCNIRNFIFPGGGKRLLLDSKKNLEDCKKVLAEFEPDIIHIHGTEYSMGKAMLEVCGSIPAILTIQGIVTRIAEEYFGGLSLIEILKMGSAKEWIKLKTPVFAKMLYKKNAKREQEVLKRVKYVTGRTDWDKAVMLTINNRLEYYRHNYNLREEFYTCEPWRKEKMLPRTIYVGAASYPLKGFHVLLDAINIVKQKYPDVKVLVPGRKLSISTPKNGNSYERYILRKIKYLGLEENIDFIGSKNSSEVVDLMRKSNICIVPSAMEGASATIREASMIGTPCICSYRGGMTELLRDGESGFYYDFPEYGVLAERIKQLFSDVSLCEKFSENIKKDSALRHDRERNYSELIRIYKEIIEKETK